MITLITLFVVVGNERINIIICVYNSKEFEIL